MNELPEYEAAIVGSLIMEPTTIDEAATAIDATDFADGRLRELFVVLVDMRESQTPINVTSLVGILKRGGSYERLGGAGLLARLSQATATPKSVSYYSAMVRQDSSRRRLRAILSDVGASLDAGNDAEKLIDELDSRLLDLRERSTITDKVVPLHDAAGRLCDAIDSATATNTTRGLRTGLQCFDVINGGYQNGTLNVIAARPSNGKSVLGLQFATQIGTGFEFPINEGRSTVVGRQAPLPTLFISLEMSEEELTSRSLASATSIDGRRINSYRVTDHQRQKLRQAAEKMRDTLTSIWEPTRATVSAIRAKARIHARQFGLSCVVVDYLQMVDSERGSKHEKETYRIGEICRQFKVMARELDIPVVLLCQLNRDAENKKPTLSQLADSGKIEQHADTITAIHRQRGDSDQASLMLLKWRNGQTPEIEIQFDRQHSRFVDIVEEIQDHPNYQPDFAEYAK